MHGPLTIAFVMDPIEAVDVSADTTFALMLEAQSRGHRVLYVEPTALGIRDGQAVTWTHPVKLQREQGNHVAKGPAELLVLDRDVDLVFQRTDPPVDEEYIFATQLLGTCRRTLVLNRPSAILAYNEKILALHFPDLMPETLISRDPDDLRAFMADLGGEMIVKPLDGRGGEGVFLVGTDDRNLNSILEQSTRFGTRLVMGQRYLPAVREGDKRILLLEGEALGALLRVPAGNDVRANLHVGGTAARGILDAADHAIVERIGPFLRREGLFFVGIDVIGGKLTEINVTSPTCIQEIDDIEGVRLEERVIDRAEERVHAHRYSQARRSTDGGVRNV